jgi:hypothetical protein
MRRPDLKSLIAGAAGAAAVFLALPSHPAAQCAFSNIENSQDQSPHRVREYDGSGFTATWSGTPQGMAIERTGATGAVLWKRAYDSQSMNYHFSANRYAGYIHVWHIGQTGRTQSVFRMLTVNAFTGDSVGTDTLYLDSSQYLRGTFIATQRGGMLSCINSWGGSQGARKTLLAILSSGPGKTEWTTDLLAEAEYRSPGTSFMFAGGVETADGRYVIAVAATTFSLGSELAEEMLLFRLNSLGGVEWLGFAKSIPCFMARNTKRMHYAVYSHVTLGLNYAPVRGGSAISLEQSVLTDAEAATGLEPLRDRGADAAARTASGMRGGAFGFGYGEGAVRAWFRADGSGIRP